MKQRLNFLPEFDILKLSRRENTIQAGRPMGLLDHGLFSKDEAAPQQPRLF